MCSLDDTHPTVTQEFRKGKFVLSKTNRLFSTIALDHAHEQNNKVMKDQGGIIGITQDPDALLRWSVTGPELVRFISEFKSSIVGKTEAKNVYKHHEQTFSTQKLFVQQVKSVVEEFQTLGNPFSEGNDEMIQLHTRDIMDDESVQCLMTIKQRGQEKYHNFIEHRLKTNSIHITDTITKTSVTLFNKSPTKPRRLPHTYALLKEETALFSKLYMACQTRQGDLPAFFRHENYPFPPSLSQNGSLRTGTKSDLIGCLEQQCASTNIAPRTKVTIVDGAVLVNALRPTKHEKIFGEYAERIFCRYILQNYRFCLRLDIIWDQYFENSIKNLIRDIRAAGYTHHKATKHVETTTPLPKKWGQFLKNSHNKTELFSFLNKELMKVAPSEQQLILTEGSDVICSQSRNLKNLAPCNHEEADTRIMLHIADAYKQGYTKILVRTVDTDVVVIAISLLAHINLEELWVACEVGKYFRYVPVHEIATSLGPHKSLALPLFHAFTGCDTVSQFHHIGKKTAWKTWNNHEKFTDVFLKLADAPQELTEEDINSMEEFTVLLYDSTTTIKSVDDLRLVLFTQKGRQMLDLPPTKSALEQHIKRAVLQGGFYWSSTTSPTRVLPSADFEAGLRVIYENRSGHQSLRQLLLAQNLPDANVDPNVLTVYA